MDISNNHIGSYSYESFEKQSTYSSSHFPDSTEVEIGKIRKPWMILFLSIVTFGMYLFWWYYIINHELANYDSRIRANPIVSIIAISGGFIAALSHHPDFVVLFLIIGIFSWMRTGCRIKKALNLCGSTSRCSIFLGLVLAIVFPVGAAYYQMELDRLWVDSSNL